MANGHAETELALDGSARMHDGVRSSSAAFNTEPQRIPVIATANIVLFMPWIIHGVSLCKSDFCVTQTRSIIGRRLVDVKAEIVHPLTLEK